MRRIRIGGPGLLSFGTHVYRRIVGNSVKSSVRFNFDGSPRGGGLDNSLWEEYSTEVIEAQIDKAGNAGQETLLGDDYFIKHAQDYCRENGDDYNPEAFVQYLENQLGSDYFNAINIIIEECSEELFEAWDAAYSNDGIGDKMFGDFYRSNTVYGTFGNAAAAYSVRASAKYGTRNWYGSKAHLADKRKTITTFLKNNPGGRSRTQPGSPYAGRTTTQSNAVSRRTIQRFLAANPNGTRRVP